MKIATWNVNSIKARMDNVLEWLKAAAPDVALLQEIKCQEDSFPRLEIEALGYEAAVVGQKSYNGVAILARHPLEDVVVTLPGDDADDQARYVEASVDGVRVASLYLPNGNPVSSEKFAYKIRWMERLRAHVQSRLLPAERVLVLAGDYNVCPRDLDVYDPKSFAEDALCQPESRRQFRALLNLGLTEAWRALHGEVTRGYTFWDYQGGAWQNDNGLRIDHLLLSPQAADRLRTCEIDKEPRARPKASDHTPIWCDLDI
jgi:exodeoxyribonuclease-3